MWDVWQIGAVVAGPVIGSFLGLVSLRAPAGAPLVHGRSRCAGCDRPLAAWELVPLLSALVLRGRCACQRSAIPRRYPALEGGCLLLGLWAALTASGPLALLTAALGWTLLLIAVLDLEHLWLPDALTVPLGLAGLAQAWWWGEAGSALLGAIVGFGALWLVARGYRRLRGRDGLGDGDPLLLGAAGAWLGWSALPSVVLVAVAVTGLGVLLARTRWERQTPVPFAPGLCAGLWLVWLYGPVPGWLGL